MRKALIPATILALGTLCYFGYRLHLQNVAATAARTPLVSSLTDPQSVQFRNERAVTRAGAICGEFNAKNKLGGYVGFRRFISDGKQYAVEGTTLSAWNIEASTPRPEPEFVEIHQKLKEGKWDRETLDIFSTELFDWLWKTQCEG